MRGFPERLPAGMLQIITTADKGFFPADHLDANKTSMISLLMQQGRRLNDD